MQITHSNISADSTDNSRSIEPGIDGEDEEMDEAEGTVLRNMSSSNYNHIVPTHRMYPSNVSGISGLGINLDVLSESNENDVLELYRDMSSNTDYNVVNGMTMNGPTPDTPNGNTPHHRNMSSNMTMTPTMNSPTPDTPNGHHKRMHTQQGSVAMVGFDAAGGNV